MKLACFLAITLLSAPILAQGGDSDNDERNAQKVECNQDLMRSYMLKGREFSSKEDPLLICSDVVHNCCIKHDQQRIFHYVKNILPIRLNEHKDRIKIAFEKLKKLHRSIGRTYTNFVGSQQKITWCRIRHRAWENFNMPAMEERFERFMEKFYEHSLNHYQKFYCALCDGWMHGQSFVKRGNQTEMLVSHSFCMSYIELNEESIEFWNNDILRYLKLLQDVVDCTHYSQSYNLTFYDEKVQDTANKALACLRTFGTEKAKTCLPICEHMSFSNLNNWVHGDSVFLTRTINFFERFFKNREVGEFISMEMRSFYKRFETLKSFTPVQENQFVKMIINRTYPQIRRDDPLQILNEGIAQGVRRFDRGLGQTSAEQDSAMPQQGYGYLQQPVDVSQDAINNSMLPALPPNRLLQGYDPAAKQITQIRKPKAQSNNDLAKTYDQIGISKTSSGEFIYKPFVQLINLDLLKRNVGNVGLQFTKYAQVFFKMTETEFNKKLFEFRPSDNFLPKLEALVGDFNQSFIKGLDRCVVTYFKVDRANYQDETPQSRRLYLSVAAKDKRVKAKTIKKN